MNKSGRSVKKTPEKKKKTRQSPIFGEIKEGLEQAIDMVNHPPHYTDGGIETIDFIEAKQLPFHLANVVKYVSRAGKKADALEDLKKAQWYLNRYIGVVERELGEECEDECTDDDTFDAMVEVAQVLAQAAMFKSEKDKDGKSGKKSKVRSGKKGKSLNSDGEDDGEDDGEINNKRTIGFKMTDDATEVK